MRKKSLRILFCAAAACAAALRLCQMVAFTEYRTGFIDRDYTVIFCVFSVIIFLVTAAVSVFALASGPRGEESRRFSLAFSISSFVTAAAIILDMLFSNAAGVPQGIRTVCIAAGAASAVYFALLGIRPLVHFAFSPKFSALPPLFFAVRAATLFISFSRQSVTSDTVFDVCVYCLGMLFLLEIARAANGASEKNSVKKIAVFGISGALLSLCSSLPQFILAVFYREALHNGAAGAILPFAFGLFAACTVFSRVDFKPDKAHRLGVYYVSKH